MAKDETHSERPEAPTQERAPDVAADDKAIHGVRLPLLLVALCLSMCIMGMVIAHVC